MIMVFVLGAIFGLLIGGALGFSIGWDRGRQQ